MARVRERLLVVDDDQSVRTLICEALRLADFECVEASSGYEAIQALKDPAISLVVLDLSMPGMDGHTTLARMRSGRDSRPVLVVTARQDPVDLATSFEAGADDYLRKPFSVEELAWRCRSLLRRLAEPAMDPIVRRGDICLDTQGHRVTLAGEPVELSATEFRLLEFMMSNPGQVLHRSQLLQHVWGYAHAVDTHVVDTYISYLRRKLTPVDPFRTVRGVGYEFKRQP